MTWEQDQEQFYAGVRSERVPFVLNDSVRIVSGPNAGREAAVISLVASDSKTAYQIELLEEPYGDVTLDHT